MGVSHFPGCKPNDIMCSLARSAVRAGVYTSWAQHNIIQAQYFRDQDNIASYLRSNTFLTSINNELEESRNETYARHLLTLSHLVLVLFNNEKTVIPKESAWFGSYAPREPGDPLTIVPMRLQPLYVEDWIGLRELDESGRLVMLTCDGEHMQLSWECLEPILTTYLGEAETWRLIVQSAR